MRDWCVRDHVVYRWCAVSCGALAARASCVLSSASRGLTWPGRSSWRPWTMRLWIYAGEFEPVSNGWGPVLSLRVSKSTIHTSYPPKEHSQLRHSTLTIL